MNYTELLKKIADNCETNTFRYNFFINEANASDHMALEWKNGGEGEAESLSFHQLLQKSLWLGSYMYNKGWRNKTVCMLGATSWKWILFFTSMLSGSIKILPLDPSLPEDEMKRRIEFCGTDIVLYDREFPVLNKLSGVEKHGFDEIDNMIEEGKMLTESGYSEWINDYIKGDQQALMFFSSGTGGKYKCAVLSQQSVPHLGQPFTGQEYGHTCCILNLPLFHISGHCLLLGNLLTGNPTYISAGLRFLLGEYEYVQPTGGYMVPAQAIMLAEMIKDKSKEEAKRLLGNNLYALRICGAPLPKNIKEMFEGLGVISISDYGMTETCGAVSSALYKDGKLVSKQGTVGILLDCFDYKIDDPDENGIGELLLSGPAIFDGYLNDPEETEKMLDGGWLHTGDIGFVDDEKFLYIVGRKKNIILLASGENIIPEEIEKDLSAIPQIKECAVYEKDDELTAGIYIEPGDDYKEKKSLVEKAVFELNGRMPSYKRITRLEITDVPLPKTAVGKIIRGNNAEE